MSRAKDHIIDLRYPNIRLEIVLGDNTIVMAVGIGTISFERELMSPLMFGDVLYVLGLKKNLISIFLHLG
jgi:hypothetical protein